MAEIHSIKLRIRGIGETRKVTRAMKLISAAKLKKARQMLEASKPYFGKVKNTMADILLHSAGIESLYFGNADGTGKNSESPANSSGRDVYVVLTGDKGLAGGYNSNIFKFAEARFCKDDSPLLLAAGRTGYNYFTGKGYDVDHGFICPIDNPNIQRADMISDAILRLYGESGACRIYLVYTRMVSAIRLEPQLMRLLPLQLESLLADLGVPGAGSGMPSNERYDEDLVYEPDPGTVLDALIPMYLTGVVFGALVEAFTCEQCARMTAMDNATSNADDMLQSLNLQYNRARQAAITQEISEIVGGAAS